MHQNEYPSYCALLLVHSAFLMALLSFEMTFFLSLHMHAWTVGPPGLECGLPKETQVVHFVYSSIPRTKNSLKQVR